MGRTNEEPLSRPRQGVRRSPTKRSRQMQEFTIAKEEGDQEEAYTGAEMRAGHKRSRHRISNVTAVSGKSTNRFDILCDDLVISILACLSSRARAPSHIIAVMLTCKRFSVLATQKRVLAHASKHAVGVRASAWGKDAEKFLRLCVDAGNLEACFTLGMIIFYCKGERREGVRLLAKAAIAWHGDALFALAIMQFNGSGGKASDKNTRAGVTLCARAARAGSVEAVRELGHCLMEGNGLPRDAVAGRQLLLDANRKEAVRFVSGRNWSFRGARGCSAAKVEEEAKCGGRTAERARCLEAWKEVLGRSLLSEYGCSFPLRWLLETAHPVHGFLAEWFAMQPPGDLRVCSHALCGRAETRPLEFRQCGVCASVFYCSRSCQSTDWKLRHMLLCGASLPLLLRS